MRRVLTAAILAAAALPALAQQPPAGPVPAGPMTVEGLDRGLVNLGLMAGHAYQCLPEGDRAAAQRSILVFNTQLIAEMGANAAFRFASSFGAGSSHDVDRGFCERSLADWRKLVQDYRLDR